jgi:hypothetical protein
MNVTVITALYDIGREKYGDGRSIEEYLTWLEKTLKLNCNFVIYTEERFQNFISSRRGTANTKIILQKLEDVPYFKYKKDMDRIILSEDYRKKIGDVNRVECNLSLYNIIQYSKFEWIRDAINNSYLNSEFYFWMDAGLSRFFNTDATNMEWPQNHSMMKPGKFLIQGNMNTPRYYHNWPGDDNYMLDNNSILCGGLFGGDKDTIIKIADLTKELFEHYLSQNIINNEQIVLGILLKRYPKLFNPYINLNGATMPLFTALYEKN